MTVKHINLSEDFDDLAEIWRVCFPEDAAYGEIFLKETAEKTTGLAAYVDGKPVSMAFLIPACFSVDKTRYTAKYVYGVATLPTFRHQGFVAEILKYVAENSDAEILFLHPANPQLTAFYEKQKYRTVLYANLVQPPENDDSDDLELNILPFDATKYVTFRQKWFNDKNICHAEFDISLLSTLLSHYQMIVTEKGMALMVLSEDAVFLPEIMVIEQELPFLLQELKKRFPEKKIIATGVGDTVPVGMVLPLTENAEKAINKYEKIPFSGTMFDV